MQSDWATVKGTLHTWYVCPPIELSEQPDEIGTTMLIFQVGDIKPKSLHDFIKVRLVLNGTTKTQIRPRGSKALSSGASSLHRRWMLPSQLGYPPWSVHNFHLGTQQPLTTMLHFFSSSLFKQLPYTLKHFFCEKFNISLYSPFSHCLMNFGGPMFFCKYSLFYLCRCMVASSCLLLAELCVPLKIHMLKS